MPSHDSTLFIDAGALLALASELSSAAQDDHQVLQLYAQLAADKRHSRDSDPLAWHDLYIAALKRFGMHLPRTEHRWFDAQPGQPRTLADWLAPAQHDPAWAGMSLALQRMAEGAGDDQARQLLHNQAVQHTAEHSSLSLLLVRVAADAAVDLWFVRLRSRVLIERNLFAQVFAGDALFGRVDVFHHGGSLGEDYAANRATLAGQVGTHRRSLLLPVTNATRRQP